MKRHIFAFMAVFCATFTPSLAQMSNEEWTRSYTLCTEDRQVRACALLINEGLESVQECEKSCNDIGRIFHYAGLRKQAIEYYLKAGLNGNVYAIHNIGLMLHEEGEFSEAVEYYAIACDNGVMLSCNNLGVLFRNGLGVPKDLAKARGFYTLACDNKESTACFNLGAIYAFGIGTNINIPLARSYFDKSCNLGFHIACEINADTLRPEDLKKFKQESGNELRGLDI